MTKTTPGQLASSCNVSYCLDHTVAQWAVYWGVLVKAWWAGCSWDVPGTDPGFCEVGFELWALKAQKARGCRGMLPWNILKSGTVRDTISWAFRLNLRKEGGSTEPTEPPLDLPQCSEGFSNGKLQLPHRNCMHWWTIGSGTVLCGGWNCMDVRIPGSHLSTMYYIMAFVVLNFPSADILQSIFILKKKLFYSEAVCTLSSK